MEPMPCPFCGETPTVKDRRDSSIVWKDSYALPFQISCRNPRCPMDMVVTHKYTSRDDAISAWNTRRWPEVQAVEARQEPSPVNNGNVFCKDCKRYIPSHSRYLLGRCGFMGRFVHLEDFCSFGRFA